MWAITPGTLGGRGESGSSSIRAEHLKKNFRRSKRNFNGGAGASYAMLTIGRVFICFFGGGWKNMRARSTQYQPVHVVGPHCAPKMGGTRVYNSGRGSRTALKNIFSAFENKCREGGSLQSGGPRHWEPRTSGERIFWPNHCDLVETGRLTAC